MAFHSETQKIRPRIKKYLDNKENVLDYGCGGDKIVPHALGIDIRPLPGVDIVTESAEDVYDLSSSLQNFKNNTDAIYSSHFLEHVKDDKKLMRSWISMLKTGGYLILYLPDDNLYDNSKNPEHLHRYVYEEFVEHFIPSFHQLELIEHGLDAGHDRYSFYVVCQKKGKKNR